MEITSTRVAPEGQMISVEFLGEGGELISVVMSNVENNILAEDAVQHARALLAQVSTFGSGPDDAINSYDALSNGNFDDGRDDATAEIAEKASENALTSGQGADAKLESPHLDRETRAETSTTSSDIPN